MGLNNTCNTWQKIFIHQTLHNWKMLEEGLSKTDFETLFKSEEGNIYLQYYFVFL